MGTMRTIIVGVDGSRVALDAVQWAANEAHIRDSVLTIVFAEDWALYDLPPFPVAGKTAQEVADETAEDALEQARVGAHKVAPGIDVRSISTRGAPEKALIEHAKDANLLVVGRTGMGAFSRLLFGSTTAKVVHHAPCPVVVVPPSEDSGSGSDRFQPQIIVGVDRSEFTQSALEFAFEEASLRNLSITAVRAWMNGLLDAPALRATDKPFLDDLNDEQERILAEALAGWTEKFPQVDVRREVVNEHPVQALLARTTGENLLVVGAKGEGGFYNLLLGSTTDALLRHANCPVIVTR